MEVYTEKTNDSSKGYKMSKSETEEIVAMAVDKMAMKYFEQIGKESMNLQEVTQEAYDLADDNLRLEERIQELEERIQELNKEANDLKMSLLQANSSHAHVRRAKEKIYDSLHEMTLKHSQAVCERGAMERRLEKALSEGVDGRVKELQECYNELEQIRVDETNELKGQIGKLGDQLANTQIKYDQCYQYLITQAQRKAEDSSTAWNKIQFGEYPWEAL